jgi:creatinine amidohydrolase
MLASHAVACLASEVEPAVVFPPYPWGVNHESCHLPGAVALRRDLVLALLENVCDEIGRNGFRKIILLQGHGGNRFVLPLFVQSSVERARPYLLYYLNVRQGDLSDILETSEIGHACEWETSISLHLFGELVKMEAVPKEPFANRGRNKQLMEENLYSPVDWYSMFPTMYVGDASKASRRKGEAIVERRVKALASAIRAVKEDAATQGLLDEFMAGRERPKSAY